MEILKALAAVFIAIILIALVVGLGFVFSIAGSIIGTLMLIALGILIVAAGIYEWWDTPKQPRK